MIDITKCIGCRKGVWPLIKKDDQYLHLDVFASEDAGATYECLNSDKIGDQLVPIEGRGTFKPNSELLEIFFFQEAWWEDIIYLCRETFSQHSETADFLNSKHEGKTLITSSNEIIEEKLLNKAKENSIDVSEETYPNLLLWKNC
jgi:hypothetical protein